MRLHVFIVSTVLTVSAARPAPAQNCPSALSCVPWFVEGKTSLTWSNPVVYDAIVVTRNGSPVDGSPFAGSTTSFVDDAPGDFQNDYAVIAQLDGRDCEAVQCSTRYPTTLIEEGAVWKYFGSPSPPDGPPGAWREVDYDDRNWFEGPTGIGFGDNDDKTIVKDMVDNYASLLTRHTFEVADPEVFPGFVLRIFYDDGFVAYLNGAEVARSPNMMEHGMDVPLDAFAGGPHEAYEAEEFAIDASFLRAGENVLAFQVHNASLGSGDLSFLPSLHAGTCHAPITNLGCEFDRAQGTVRLSWSAAPYGKITVTRNGAPLPGSPFDLGTSSVVDAAPGERDNTYRVAGWIGATECAAATCSISCAERFPNAIDCSVQSVAGATQADLSWRQRSEAETIDLFRIGDGEEEHIATIAGDAVGFNDVEVELARSLRTVSYRAVFRFATGETCTISCPEIRLCPLELYADFVDTAESTGVQLTWQNIVKAWELITVSRNHAKIATLDGQATAYFDPQVTSFEVGERIEYRVIAVDRHGGECLLSRATTAPFAEVAAYAAPAGGWDYRLAFPPGSTLYAAEPMTRGNLDGRWIRGRFDAWDGSAPSEVGAAPDGFAPGGISVETLAGAGACRENINVLRMLDPGHPGNPQDALAEVYPDAYAEPANSRFTLGLEIGSGRHLLREGMTFAARWRLNPSPPSFMEAGRFGDASKTNDNLLQVGAYYVDRRTRFGDTPAVLGFSLHELPGVLVSRMWENNVFAGADPTEFVSVWATISDPDGDERYDLAVYVNGRETPEVNFGTGAGVELAEPSVDFGGDYGTYLVLSLSNLWDDADLQIDYIAYKEGIHPPVTGRCADDPFRRGDVDGDGRVLINDAIWVLNYLFRGNVAPPRCPDAVDIDDDGSLTVTDPIRLLNVLFAGVGVVPPPGFQECGEDPTGDEFAACEYAACR